MKAYNMKITDNVQEMAELGRRLTLDKPEAYPPDFIGAFLARFRSFFETDDELLSVLYCAIYCRELYGTSILEYSTFRFAEKSHAERTGYITWNSRFLYSAFLNKPSENHFLDNKFEAYTLLKRFYKREAMLLSCESDYPAFCAFVERNPSIFVKPNNLDLAEGAHPLEYLDGDLRKTFDALLNEAACISSTEIKREVDHSLILEDRIIPSEFMRALNPHELSLLRVNTVNIKGRVHFFYPCLRLLVGDGEERRGEDYSYNALLDAETGEVISNGKHSMGDTDVNPVTGLRLQGTLLPDWAELRAMLTEAAQLLPKTRYIGWDVTHSDKGWCIIEGNPEGEFFYQLCAGHGLKDEFEKLIGFSLPYDYWKRVM